MGFASLTRTREQRAKIAQTLSSLPLLGTPQTSANPGPLPMTLDLSQGRAIVCGRTVPWGCVYISRGQKRTRNLYKFFVLAVQCTFILWKIPLYMNSSIYKKSESNFAFKKKWLFIFVDLYLFITYSLWVITLIWQEYK